MRNEISHGFHNAIWWKVSEATTFCIMLHTVLQPYIRSDSESSLILLSEFSTWICVISLYDAEYECLNQTNLPVYLLDSGQSTKFRNVLLTIYSLWTVWFTRYIFRLVSYTEKRQLQNEIDKFCTYVKSLSKEKRTRD